MASDSITRGRIQGAVGMAAAAVLVCVAAPAILDLSPAPAFRCTDAGSTCVVPVEVNTYMGGLLWHCNLKLSSEVTVPRQYTAIEWRIGKAGFSFVGGGHAVSILNDAGDFSPGAGTTATVFQLLRPTSPVSQRGYNYNVSVQSDAGEFCMVPTLPRIKNE